MIVCTCSFYLARVMHSSKQVPSLSVLVLPLLWFLFDKGLMVACLMREWFYCLGLYRALRSLQFFTLRLIKQVISRIECNADLFYWAQ